MEDQMNERKPLLEENKKTDEFSDPSIDNATDGKCKKRTEKVCQAKNLEAERKRRRKLNDKLYSLRALVPNISKLDRAAILEDAINYIKELQKEAKNLQTELEERSEDATKSGCNDPVNGSFTSCFHKESSDVENTNTEPQVEVLQIDRSELFVKVLCEHKPCGFVRLLEALSSMGPQAIHVCAARNRCLVSTIFIVEKLRESETIEADDVKESLLDRARLVQEEHGLVQFHAGKTRSS